MSHSNLIIKPQKSRLWYITVGFLLLFLLVTIYVAGRYLSLADLASTKEELVISQMHLAETQNALDRASESLVMQKQSSQVDNQSNQELVNSVKNMQQTQNDLEEELKFYRKIMAPERDREGLAIDAMKISQADRSDEFHFRLTLIQAGKQSQFLKGDIVLRLSGLLNGKNTEYDFRELGTFKVKHFQFQFKYFQNIQGFIHLPSGFEAKKLTVAAKTKGRRKNQKVEKQMVWQPEESQNYVRQ